MNQTARAVFVGLFTLSLGGCVIHVSDDGASWRDDWRERQEYNRNVISRLEIGLTRTEVEERLGAPDFTEAYTHDGARYHILHYRTQHRHSDGETTIDETTPLVLRDGALEGWGPSLYARVAEHAEQ